MTDLDQLDSDTPDPDIAEFERLGRRAGAELRTPAPPDGPAAVRTTTTRRRVTKLAVSVAVLLVLISAGVLAAVHDPKTEPPTDNVTTVVPQRVVLSGHAGLVTALDATAAGEVVATGGEDGTVRVWNSYTGEEITRIDLGFDEPIWDVALSADGTRVAAWTGQTSRYWNTAGTATTPFAVPWDDPSYQPLGPEVTSPDGSMMVRTGGFSSASLRDVASRALLAALDGGAGRSGGAAFSNDGALVVVKFGRWVKVWRTDTYAEVQTIAFPAYNSTADLMQFLPGDDRIAFTVEDVVIIEAIDPT